MDPLGSLINSIKALPLGRFVIHVLDRLVAFLWRLPVIGKYINRIATHYLATRTHPRPRPFSLWSEVPAPQNSNGPVSDYTSWPGLTDRTFSSRHLPPLNEPLTLPSLDAATELFMHEGGTPMRTDRSSVLFMFFAQWFTDSFMRVNGEDRRKNSSNHDIDLCQIYGLDEATCSLLRAKKDGKLQHNETITHAQFPDLLFDELDNGELRVKCKYKELPHLNKTIELFEKFSTDKNRKKFLYATGLDNGNSSIGYTAITTLFLREHNRICDLLIAAYGTQWRRTQDPAYFNERVFQTARMINTCLVLRLVVEEYINHIVGKKSFRLDHQFAERKPWYRTNWVSIEFNLLYRWHGMVPYAMQVNDQSVDAKDYRFNNELLETLGIETILTAASRQAAGRIGLGNTPAFLKHAEMLSLQMGRDFKLRSYNDYRKQFKMRPLADFTELTGDTRLQQKLEQEYTHIDNLEFITGIFAEDHQGDAIFGELLETMVSYDAFTQIYTNPLLSTQIHNEQTLTKVGLDIINSTHSLQELADRNKLTGTEVQMSFAAPGIKT